MHSLTNPARRGGGTAVIAIHTEQGFVICADGRQQEYAGHVVTDEEQKIFQLTPPCSQLCYAHAGLTTFADEATGKIIWDAREHLARLVRLHSRDLSGGFDHFVSILADKLAAAIMDMKDSDPEVEFPSTTEIVLQLVLAGYLSGVSCLGKILLRHRDQFLLEPEIRADEPSKTAAVLVVPELLLIALLEKKDERLSPYWCDSIMRLLQGQDISLGQASEAARACVGACCDPVAEEVAPECKAMGGRVHMATVTRGTGFQWVIPPMHAR